MKYETYKCDICGFEQVGDNMTSIGLNFHNNSYLADNRTYHVCRKCEAMLGYSRIDKQQLKSVFDNAFSALVEAITKQIKKEENE